MPDLCVNGGKCSDSKDSFTCNCPLSIRDLPYTDGRCNVGELQNRDNKTETQTDRMNTGLLLSQRSTSSEIDLKCKVGRENLLKYGR